MNNYKIEDRFDKNIINQTESNWIAYQTADDKLLVSDSSLFCDWSLDDCVNFIFAFYIFLIVTVSVTLVFV